MSNQITIDAQELVRFNKAFQEIIATSKRSIADEIFFKARDLAFKLYKHFRKSSILSKNPSWRDPMAMGQALGWRIKAFKNGAEVRPRPPLITQNLGFSKHDKKRFYKDVRTGTTQKGKDFKGILNRRLDADGYISTGWLPRVWRRLRRRSELRDVVHSRGSVTVSGADGPMFTIELTNNTPGAEQVNQRYGHASKAVAEVTADMENKIRERLEKGLYARLVVGAMR